MIHKWLYSILAMLLMIAVPLNTVAAGRLSRGPEGEVYEQSFNVERFVLPEDAQALVVVEGTFGSQCKVHAYEKGENGWTKLMETDGWLGHNGMSNNRVAGDSTTPIGVFQMNTPFGQAEALEGFPANYIRVNDTYIWSGVKNKLCLRSEVDETSPEEDGELVWAPAYWPVYEYVIDMGYNRNAIAHKGSALFIHCMEENEDGSSGCVAISRDEMIRLMRLYGKYGDGHCYIALAPFGTFSLIYDTYGVNDGLSPDGLFSVHGGPGYSSQSGPGAVSESAAEETSQNVSGDASQTGPGDTAGSGTAGSSQSGNTTRSGAESPQGGAVTRSGPEDAPESGSGDVSLQGPGSTSQSGPGSSAANTRE